jgi:hypothetical protein
LSSTSLLSLFVVNLRLLLPHHMPHHIPPIPGSSTGSRGCDAPQA